MNDSYSPIGVFDSGVGGLTVLRALASRLVDEDFIYLGDLARVPYGSKSAETVSRYALECTSYLVSRGVKAVVIACNTATALALESLRAEFSVPIFGVIDAGVRAGLSASERKRVIVLGTQATVGSHAYREAFLVHDPQMQVEELACPLLVPLAEEGWWDHSVTREVIAHYLSKASPGFDTVVLGCTHYPLLMPSLRSVVGPEISLVHGADVLASDVESALSQVSLLSSSKHRTLRFLTTDSSRQIHAFAEPLFGESIAFEHVTLGSSGFRRSQVAPAPRVVGVTDGSAAPLDSLYS